MAEIKGEKGKNSRSGNIAPAPWSTTALVAVLKRRRTKAESVAALKRSGILTKDGKLAQKYKSWGNKPSRTPDASESVLP